MTTPNEPLHQGSLINPLNACPHKIMFITYILCRKYSPYEKSGGGVEVFGTRAHHWDIPPNSTRIQHCNIGRSDKQQLWSVHGEIWFIFVIQKSDIALGMGWINNPKKLEN